VFTNGDQFYPANWPPYALRNTMFTSSATSCKKGALPGSFSALEEGHAPEFASTRDRCNRQYSAHERRYGQPAPRGRQAVWYHPVRWWSWTRINNRTHREIMVIDGTVEFAGGGRIAISGAIA